MSSSSVIFSRRSAAEFQRDSFEYLFGSGPAWPAKAPAPQPAVPPTIVIDDEFVGEVDEPTLGSPRPEYRLDASGDTLSELLEGAEIWVIEDDGVARSRQSLADADLDERTLAAVDYAIAKAFVSQAEAARDKRT